MIVDTSVIVAIVLREAGSERMAEAIADAEWPRMSAANWFEAAMVLQSRGGETTAARFDHMIQIEGIEVVDFTPGQAILAREAWQRFSKGRHSAALNFGDCMAYATANDLREPLLFKSNDFSHTDIEPALKD